MRLADGSFIVGIDLGTTNSLVATIDNGRPVIIPNRLGEPLTPSAVSLDGETVLVGAAARARAATHPTATALSFKRDMGTRRTHELGAEAFTPEELSALVLASLKADAEEALGGVVSEAVVTVPAYFGEAQRQATRRAAALAGLKCERIINEPTAAALAYGFQSRVGEQLVAVVDLGGGTCDATVLRLTDGIIEILGSSGDIRLGGDDFIATLADHALAEVPERIPRTPALHAVARESAERVTKALSTQTAVTTSLVLPDGREPIPWTVTREAAEAAWAGLLRRIEAPIHTSLRDARVRAEDVSDVLLVGGATRAPCVQDVVARIFDRPPLHSLQPDEAIAQGAAVQAALKIGHQSVDDIVATDIAPFSLGITTAATMRGRIAFGLFTPIIERGTVLPVSRSKVFSTLSRSQTAIEVDVYQGEHSVAEKNTLLGSYTIEGLPAGHINSVEIRFSYDLNGLLEVDTTSLATGEASNRLITPSDGRLSPAEIEAARRRFERLKVHPRELLPNRTALERAEALYTTLLGAERQRLGLALAAFRLALEEGNEVEAARQDLVALTRSLAGPVTTEP